MKMRVSAMIMTMMLTMDTMSATTITIKNSCDHRIAFYDDRVESPMDPGAETQRILSEGFRGMFRAGSNPQATLAEFVMVGGKAWFDISIIPTGPQSGSMDCSSLDACKSLTGAVGFNEPMEVSPQSNTNGVDCRTLTCLYDGCEDGYQFPQDDTKAHNCPEGTDFTLTFCPGGPGRVIPSPTTTAPSTATATPSTTGTVEEETRSIDDSERSIVSAAGDSSISKSGSQVWGASSEEEEGQAAEASPTPVSSRFKTVSPVQAMPPSVGSNAGQKNAPATETNTKSGGGAVSTVGTVMIVLAVAAVAVAVAVIVVLHRRKKRLDAMALKAPMTPACHESTIL